MGAPAAPALIRREDPPLTRMVRPVPACSTVRPVRPAMAPATLRRNRLTGSDPVGGGKPAGERGQRPECTVVGQHDDRALVRRLCCLSQRLHQGLTRNPRSRSARRRPGRRNGPRPVACGPCAGDARYAPLRRMDDFRRRIRQCAGLRIEAHHRPAADCALIHAHADPQGQISLPCRIAPEGDGIVVVCA